MTTIVFFHVGDDASNPQQMVGSILQHMPDAYIIMCTDANTPAVDGVSERFETTGERDKIMYWRTSAFAALDLNRPAIYVDTDMTFKAPVNPGLVIGTKDIMLCAREFNCDAGFNPHQNGLDFPEYAGKPIGVVYPYLGCATVTRDGKMWKKLRMLHNACDDKFHRWYGDQEALRMLANSLNHSRWGTIKESEYACLPEHDHSGARILHYKGPLRKALLNV